MNLSKFLTMVLMVTFGALLYVHQQTETFRLAYVGQKRLVMFQELLDKNTVLRYNIQCSGSLTRIGNRITPGADFEMPNTFQLVHMDQQGKVLRLAKKENIIERLLSVKQEAQAKTFTPAALPRSSGAPSL